MDKEDIKRELIALVCVLYKEEPISKEEFYHRYDTIKGMIDELPGDDGDKDFYMDTLWEYRELFNHRRKLPNVKS